jgi:hypothetical protein
MVREEGLEVENPTEALVNEDGTFKLISPSGDVFRGSCRKGWNMQVREIGTSENVPFPEVAHHDRFDGSAHQPTSRRWQIEKIE